MDKVLEELDNQEAHLRRLARRVDRLSTDCSRVELRISAMLHSAFGSVHTTWDGAEAAPPGWPEPAVVTISRGRSQADAIVVIAQEAERLGSSVSARAIEKDLDDGRRRMPFVMDAELNEGPFVIPPAVMERDYYELLFNPQQEALLKIDNALDGLD
jgi:hypothetical protein